VNIKFSSFMIIVYALTWFVFVLSAALVPNNYGSSYSVIALALLGGLQCLAILFSRVNIKSLVIFCALINYIFVFLRVTVLSFFPENAKYLGILDFDAIQITETILFITIFYLFFYVGLFLHKKKKMKYFKTQAIENMAANNYLKLLALGIAPVVFNLYLFYVSGSGRGGDANSLRVLFTYFFHQDVFVIFTIALTGLVWSRLKELQKDAFRLWCVFFVVGGVLVGSKGHIYTLILALLFIKLLQGEFNIRISLKAVLLSTLIIGFGLVTYIVGDAIRYAGVAFEGSQVPISTLLLVVPEFVNFDTFFALFEGIARRLSHFEYIALIINNTDSSVSELINFKNAIGGYLNFLLPGTPFADAQIFSLQLMKVAYEGYPIHLILEGKGESHGDYIPFPGLFFLLFGWTKALLFVLLLGIALANIHALRWSVTSKYSYLLFILFWLCTNTLINDSFGLDHFLQKSTIFILSACFFVVMFRLIQLKVVVNKM